MKECIKCGKEIEENSLYCPHCGTKQGKKEDGFFKKEYANDIPRSICFTKS